MDRPRAVWVLSDAPYAGGAERYLEFLLDAAGPGRMGLVAVEREGLRAWIDRIEARGFAVDRLPAGSPWAEWRSFFAWVRRRRPALLHVNMPGPNDGLFALAPWLARRAGVGRIVVTEHLPSVGRIGRRGLLKRWAVPAIDRAITVCEAHRPVMAREFGYTERQLVAIPNGIDDPGSSGPGRLALPHDLARICPSGSLRIVQVGALDPRKGGHSLIDAFADAAPDASLWFVGEGPDEEAMRAHVSARGIQDRVVFTGRREDLPALLASFDLVVLASEREGMPYVLIEAMAMARPILATAVDGIPELVEPAVNGILVGADDAIALRRELRELAASPERLPRLGAAGRRRFEERFTLDRCLAHTWAQYGEEGRGWPVSS